MNPTRLQPNATTPVTTEPQRNFAVPAGNSRDRNEACPVLFQQVPVLERWIDSRAAEGVRFAVLGDFNRRFDRAGDELLLALPLVPMHEVCPVPVRMSAGELPDLPEEKKPNPFAALSALKGRTSDH